MAKSKISQVTEGMPPGLDHPENAVSYPNLTKTRQKRLDKTV
jgi:hypothetical protein